MTMLNAIIVDDEESARNILSNLLENFCTDIIVKASCEDLESAVLSIKKHKPDVVFLDIEMPQYAGYEIVNFFDKIDFEIVFITAYDQYALRAFEVAALDYLLKPIDIDRLKQSVDKIRSTVTGKMSIKQLQLLSQTIRENTVFQISIMNKGFKQYVDVNEIVAIEAQEAYSKIWLSNSETHVASKNLKHFERILTEHPSFFRSHKSWLVNLDFIESHSKTYGEIRCATGLVVKLSRYQTIALETLLKERFF